MPEWCCGFIRQCCEHFECSIYLLRDINRLDTRSPSLEERCFPWYALLLAAGLMLPSAYHGFASISPLPCHHTPSPWAGLERLELLDSFSLKQEFKDKKKKGTVHHNAGGPLNRVFIDMADI